MGTCLFVGTGHGVFRSTNSGQNWFAANEGLPESAGVDCFAVVRSDLFAGTDGGVFRSTNYGDTWSAANAGLPGPARVNCFAQIGSDLFAGTSRGVFMSKNDGSAWAAVNAGLPKNPEITALASKGPNLFASVRHSTSDDTDEEVVVVPYYFSNDGIYLSVDKGKSWAPVNAGLPNDILAKSFTVNGSDLIAGIAHVEYGKYQNESGRGVFLTRDDGASWSPVNAGLPDRASIHCFLSTGTDLFAGTSNRGLWRLPLSALR
jgi:ligand-binding sensor domain-containing protein